MLKTLKLIFLDLNRTLLLMQSKVTPAPLAAISFDVGTLYIYIFSGLLLVLIIIDFLNLNPRLYIIFNDDHLVSFNPMCNFSASYAIHRFVMC